MKFIIISDSKIISPRLAPSLSFLRLVFKDFFIKFSFLKMLLPNIIADQWVRAPRVVLILLGFLSNKDCPQHFKVYIAAEKENGMTL